MKVKNKFEGRLYMAKILIHGSGHQAASWNETISYMENNDDILCPNLVSVLKGKEASYANLYSSFTEYCGKIDGQVHLCGISLGGILALNYALDFPENVKTLVLIGTPYKIPKAAFAFQNMIFRFLPKSPAQRQISPYPPPYPWTASAATRPRPPPSPPRQSPGAFSEPAGGSAPS